jgi:hypothetical protein
MECSNLGFIRSNAALVVFYRWSYDHLFILNTLLPSGYVGQQILLSAILLSYLSVSAYTLFMMGGFKKPGPKAVVKCEECGRSFGNERSWPASK